jgi:hypothetical protein
MVWVQREVGGKCTARLSFHVEKRRNLSNIAMNLAQFKFTIKIVAEVRRARWPHAMLLTRVLFCMIVQLCECVTHGLSRSVNLVSPKISTATYG